jgi:hypothetical protein
LLSTKLSAPRLPHSLVERERLLAELDAACSTPLTLLSLRASKHPEQVAWFVNTNFKLIESVQVSWPTERRNFRKIDGSLCLES